MNYKNLWPILRKTFSAWNDHNAPRMGAALAFYSILSLAPLVILILAIVAFVFGHSNAQTLGFRIYLDSAGSVSHRAKPGRISKKTSLMIATPTFAEIK